MPDAFSRVGLLALQLMIEQVLAMKHAASCEPLAESLQETHVP